MERPAIVEYLFRFFSQKRVLGLALAPLLLAWLPVMLVPNVLGARGVPVIMIGDTRIDGFDRRRLDAALKAAKDI